MWAETVVDAPARPSTRQHTRGTGGHSGCACDFRGGVLLALRVSGFWQPICCDTRCDLSEQNFMQHFMRPIATKPFHLAPPLSVSGT